MGPGECHKELQISIHALREEGDVVNSSSASMTCNFNPRPPRGGRRQQRHDDVVDDLFQSTPSARRATDTHAQHGNAGEFQSTPSARRATVPGGGNHAQHEISIHALREEGDPIGNDLALGETEFQSTPSARRATKVSGGHA